MKKKKASRRRAPACEGSLGHRCLVRIRHHVEHGGRRTPGKAHQRERSAGLRASFLLSRYDDPEYKKIPANWVATSGQL